MVLVHICTKLKLVGIIHAYTLVTRSDSSTNTKFRFGCVVWHRRKVDQGANVPGGARAPHPS